jgi:hypothetical protein
MSPSKGGGQMAHSSEGECHGHPNDRNQQAVADEVREDLRGACDRSIGTDGSG